MQAQLSNTARAAILVASTITEISHSRLYGTCKTRRVVHTRWAVMLVLRRKGLSFQEIGDELGKDHGTIIHGVNKASSLIRSGDSWFISLLSHLEKHLS